MMDLNNILETKTPILRPNSSSKKKFKFTLEPKRMCDLLKDKEISDAFGIDPSKLISNPYLTKCNYNSAFKDATSVFMPQRMCDLPNDVVQECSKSSVKKSEWMLPMPMRMTEFDLNLDLDNNSKCGARRKLLNSGKKVTKSSTDNHNKSTIPVLKKRISSIAKPKFNELATRKTLKITPKKFSQTSKTRMSGIMELQSARRFNPPAIEPTNKKINLKTNERTKKFSSITEENSSIEKKNVYDLVTQNCEKLSEIECSLLDLSLKINKIFEKVVNENCNRIDVDKPVETVSAVKHCSCCSLNNEQSKLELPKCEREINLDNLVVMDNTTTATSDEASAEITGINSITQSLENSTNDMKITPTTMQPEEKSTNGIRIAPADLPSLDELIIKTDDWSFKKSANRKITPATTQPEEKSTDGIKIVPTGLQSLNEFLLKKEVTLRRTSSLDNTTHLNQIRQIPEKLSEPAVENTDSTNRHEQFNNDILIKVGATSERPVLQDVASNAATNLIDKFNACVLENPVNDPEITVMSESTELSSFSDCSDIKLQDLSLLIRNLNDGSLDGDCEQSSSMPSTPKAKVRFNVDPSKHMSTPDLIESTMKCYNNLRKNSSILCTPKLPVGKHVVATPGTQPNHRKILSRKIQDQLFTLHRNSDG